MNIKLKSNYSCILLNMLDQYNKTGKIIYSFETFSFCRKLIRDLIRIMVYISKDKAKYEKLFRWIQDLQRYLFLNK